MQHAIVFVRSMPYSNAYIVLVSVFVSHESEHYLTLNRYGTTA